MVHKKIGRAIKKAVRKITRKTPAPAPKPTSRGVFQGPTRPSTDVKTFRKTGVSKPKPSRGGGGRAPTPIKTPTKQPALKITIIDKPKPSRGGGGRAPIVLKPIERRALIRREQLRLEAIKRGKGFGRLEAQRFLGGGSAIAALRSAKRKGFRFIRKEELEDKLIQEEERTFNVLTLPKKEKFLMRTLNKLERDKALIKTKQARGRLTIEDKITLASIETNKAIVGTALFGKRLYDLSKKSKITLEKIKVVPEATKKIIRNRKNIIPVSKKVLKRINLSFKRGRENTIRFSRTGTIGELVGIVAGNIILFGATSKGLRIIGKVSDQATARLSPKFVGDLSKAGTKVNIKGVKGKTIQLEVAGKIGSKTLPRETLRKQIRKGGKRTTAVSVQADRLVNLIRRKKIIRKPIANEESLSKRTRFLLKKFDNRNIKRAELLELDSLIRRGRGKGLLERSLFADPKGRIRPSRIGRETDAGLIDILSGKVKFTSSKPQILVFENTKIQNLPKSLIGVKRKLLSNKPLTSAETKKFLEFQLKKSGQFKPVGFISGEPEISLAPGEIIRRGRKIGVTLISGKKVPIISVNIVKVKKNTKQLLNKLNKGTITKSEITRLKKSLRKESGFRNNPRLISSAKTSRRVVSLKRFGGSSLASLSRKLKSRPSPRRGSPRPSPRRVSGRPSPRRVSGRPSPRPSPRRVSGRGSPRPSPRRVSGRGLPGVPIIPIKRRKKKRRSKRKSRRKQAYKVYARPLKRTKKGRKPKLIKISKVPLSKKRARDLRNYILDTSLARTGKIKRTGGKPKQPILRVPKAYSKRTSRKFRTYKIKKGKRKALPRGKVIERRSFLLDTSQEVKKIGLLRRIKQITPKKKVIKRKRKTIKRKSPRRNRGIFG